MLLWYGGEGKRPSLKCCRFVSSKQKNKREMVLKGTYYKIKRICTQGFHYNNDNIIYILYVNTFTIFIRSYETNLYKNKVYSTFEYTVKRKHITGSITCYHDVELVH